MLCVLCAVFESIAAVATQKWFSLQAMSVTITLTITCITMIRWDVFAVLPALVGSLCYCVALNATFTEYAVYCLGSIFCLLALPIVKALGKEKIRKSFITRSVFAIAVYLLFAVGRWLVSLFFFPSFSSLIAFLATDILSLLFAIVVLYICKGLDGVLEDQRAYLIRLDEERKAEQEANLNDPF